jgi:SAM-dependent methyltransferase
MERSGHWNHLYKSKHPDEVSWYRPHLDLSLSLLRSAGLSPGAAIIDVGGGTSTFVDDVLDLGFRDVTVLDLSAAAIETSRARLGERASQVHWIVGDVTLLDLESGRYDFWHDRAVFHFLVDPGARHRYVEQVRRALKPRGHIVVATFGPEGPTRCSGLEVCRYDADTLHSEFGGDFMKLSSARERHVTPWGNEQEFVYCYCRGPGSGETPPAIAGGGGPTDGTDTDV